MPQIIPIRDLRDTTKISEMCNATNEPIFVTKNGYGDMVVMSMATYEQQLAAVNMYKKIMEGKAQADRGKLKDGPQNFQNTNLATDQQSYYLTKGVHAFHDLMGYSGIYRRWFRCLYE